MGERNFFSHITEWLSVLSARDDHGPSPETGISLSLPLHGSERPLAKRAVFESRFTKLALSSRVRLQGRTEGSAFGFSSNYRRQTEDPIRCICICICLCGTGVSPVFNKRASRSLPEAHRIQASNEQMIQ